MGTDKGTGPPGGRRGQAEERARRLAEAMRANLRRRKEQQRRGRRAPQGEAEPEAAAEPVEQS